MFNMKAGILKIISLLEGIYTILSEIRDAYLENKKLNRKTLDKFEVMQILKISDSTYRRYVKKGMLRPMQLDGIDLYYREDIDSALEESRRKGRT